MISLLSKLSSTTTHTLKFEFQVNSLPTQELLVEDQLPLIDVTVTTNGFNLLKVALQKLSLKLDFSVLEKDNNSYYWKAGIHRSELSQFFDTNSTIIENIRPATLKFNYVTQFVKKVPVKVRLKPNFIVGYDLVTTLVAQPDSVSIVGPKQLLDNINQIATQNTDIDAVQQDIESTIDLDTSSFPSNVKFSAKSVVVSGQVDKFTEGKIAVPVQIINLPKNLTLSVFPKEIPVVFYTSLNAYNSINVSDFRIQCDFETLDLSSNVINPILVSYPKAVKTAKLQINNLEYIITKKND